ncbi:HAD family hydrolase [Candidatus Kaiserbacteria bacterium]|nr:HAD family hydrolase [Candidatus Kaiserbacteria bacterium]
MRPAVFVDRDGVLNEDTAYASDPKVAKLLPGVAPAIKRLNEAGMIVIVVSNQSGIARGFHTESDTRAFNAELDAQLRAEGARVDGWYYCPHLPEGKVPEYAMECECRKPKPGMLLQAAREHDIDIASSFIVGDKESDIAAGAAAGAQTILVGAGTSISDPQPPPTHLTADLPEAVELILARAVV